MWVRKPHYIGIIDNSNRPRTECEQIVAFCEDMRGKKCARFAQLAKDAEIVLHFRLPSHVALFILYYTSRDRPRTEWKEEWPDRASRLAFGDLSIRRGRPASNFVRLLAILWISGGCLGNHSTAATKTNSWGSLLTASGLGDWPRSIASVLCGRLMREERTRAEHIRKCNISFNDN